jgi:hypothetical protein
VPRRPLATLLSASTTELRAAPAVAREGSVEDTRTGLGRLPSARNFYIGLVVVSLIVAAVSLAVPSTPSYDPWSWLIWGREIIHLDLQTTGGPTWKPLPVIFTTIFALFGKIQPDLWLIVARAGAFAAVAMSFRMSIRLTRQIGSWLVKPAGDPGWLLEWLPGLAAGVICVLGLALSGGYLSSNVLGYSEGLALALILIALERHLDGHPQQAFTLGFFVALDRPEIWLFWGPYGLWLFWRDEGARKLVIGLFVLIPILWFLPEYWGSGQLLRGADRAQNVRSNSLALKSCPFCSELKDAAWPTVLLRLKAASAVLLVLVAAIAARVYRRTGARSLLTSDSRLRALVVTALYAVGGLAWFVVIAIMTQAHFSGNNRYLVFGSALIDICGAVAFGWAGQELANLVALGVRRSRALSGRALASGAVAVGSAITGIVFLEAPNWVGHTLIDIPATHGSIVYQGHLRDGVNDLVKRYGGPNKVLACGTVMTEGFQVPMVAWTLDVKMLRVQAPPPAGIDPGTFPPPNVILQTRASRNLSLLPLVHWWPKVHYTYVGTSGPFRMFTHCGS